MSAAVIWLIAGILLLGVELFTGTFVLVMLAGGAFAAAATSGLLDTPLPVDAGVFSMVSVLLLVAVRPGLRRRLQVELESDERSPVGASGRVVATVNRDGGQIKIAGELWSARSIDERVFEPGDRVTVLQLAGLTAVVSSEL